MQFENEWLYLDRSRGKTGPVSLEILRSLYQDGLIGDSTLLCPNDGVWKEVQELPGLQRFLIGTQPITEGIAANSAQQAHEAAITDLSKTKTTSPIYEIPNTTVSQRFGNVLNWLQAILFMAALTSVAVGSSYSLATRDEDPIFVGMLSGLVFALVGLIIAAIAYIVSGEFRLLPLTYRWRVIALLIGLPTLGCLSVALFSDSVTIQAATIAEGFGGIFPIWLIAYLLGRFAIKSLEVPQMILVTTFSAFAITIVIAGFGNTNGGNWNPPIDSYTISALFVFFLRYGLWFLRNSEGEENPAE
jgi:hypothetical protein